MYFPLCFLLLAALANGQVVETQMPFGTSTMARMNLLGFGTWNLDRSNATDAVSHAIQTGYRHIDCAAAYSNEDLVGKGIAHGMEKANLDRSDIWVTSKLWNDHHAPDKVEEAIDKTLSELGLEYLDLYHMHWPVASTKSGNEIYFVDTWKAMIQLLQSGKTRYIGISNFSPAQLETLLNSTTHVPSVHQMEMHPYLPQNEWLSYHRARGIHVTAYSPLAGTNPTYNGKPVHGPPQLLENKAMVKIAKKRNCSVAQVALSWGMSRGNSVIPKSSHAERIDENFASKQCELEDDDFETIDGLGEKYTHRYNNPSKSWGVKLYDGLDGV